MLFQHCVPTGQHAACWKFSPCVEIITGYLNKFSLVILISINFVVIVLAKFCYFGMFTVFYYGHGQLPVSIGNLCLQSLICYF